MKHIPGIGEAAGTPLRNDTKIAEGSYVDANTLNNPSFECENLTKMLLGNDSPKAFDPNTLQNGDQIAKGIKAALIALEIQQETSTSQSNKYILEYPNLSHILGDEKLNVINEFTAGMKVRFIVKHNNTGPSILTAFNLSVKPIKKENGTKELEVGDLIENSVAELVWIKTGTKNDEGYWELVTKNKHIISKYIQQYLTNNVVTKNTDQDITSLKTIVFSRMADWGEFTRLYIKNPNMDFPNIPASGKNNVSIGVDFIDKHNKIIGCVSRNIYITKKLSRQESLLSCYDSNNTKKQASFGVGFDGKNSEQEVAIATKGVQQCIISWGMPSDSFLDFNIGVSGTQYIAPFDGWVFLTGQGSAGNFGNHLGGYIQITSSSLAQSNRNNGIISINLPIRKGQVFNIYFDNITQWNIVRFVKNIAGV